MDTDQRRANLDIANAVRFRKARFRKSMKVLAGGLEAKRDRLLDAAWVITRHPDLLSGMLLHEYLEALPMFGDYRVRYVCQQHELWPLKRVEELTERQRQLIASDLLRLARRGTLREDIAA